MLEKPRAKRKQDVRLLKQVDGYYNRKTEKCVNPAGDIHS
jgi:hypothetical protein